MGRYGTAFIAGAVLGGVAGTAVTLWRAPQAGRLTRAELGEQIVAHAGPASGALGAAAGGLNAAGARLVMGVNIATRFVEELVHPTTPVNRRQGWVIPARPVASAGTTGSTGTTRTTGSVATAESAEPIGVSLDPDAPVNPSGHPISPTSGQAQAYRTAAMNVTSLFGNRERR